MTLSEAKERYEELISQLSGTVLVEDINCKKIDSITSMLKGTELYDYTPEDTKIYKDLINLKYERSCAEAQMQLLNEELKLFRATLDIDCPVYVFDGVEGIDQDKTRYKNLISRKSVLFESTKQGNEDYERFRCNNYILCFVDKPQPYPGITKTEFEELRDTFIIFYLHYGYGYLNETIDATLNVFTNNSEETRKRARVVKATHCYYGKNN